MRDETAEWLNPMLEEAHQADIDTVSLMREASFPLREVVNPPPYMQWRMLQDIPGLEARATDWVRFGQLLRELLGWDDTYPAFPDFPEARDVP